MKSATCALCFGGTLAVASATTSARLSVRGSSSTRGMVVMVRLLRGVARVSLRSHRATRLRYCSRCVAGTREHRPADEPDMLAQSVRLAREAHRRMDLLGRALDAVEVLQPLFDR